MIQVNISIGSFKKLAQLGVLEDALFEIGSAEIGAAMVPECLGVTVFIEKRGRWLVTGGRWDEKKQLFDSVVEHTNEVEARALMLIYCLENKIIKVKDVNERLARL